MERIDGYLELRVDLKEEPMEVRDFGTMLNAFADEYDEFVLHAYGREETDARFYIREIRKGSIIVGFMASAIGLMEQFVLLKQFYDITTTHLMALKSGMLPDRLPIDKADRYAAMVKAVADSEDGRMTLGFRHSDSDGSETEMILYKGDAQQLVSSVSELKAANQPKMVSYEDDIAAEQRVFMRLYQHNQDPHVSRKSRTGHKAIVRDIDEKPKTLTYENELIADEFADIVSGHDYSTLVFDVTIQAVYEGPVLKSYRLVEIHGWFEDDEAAA